MLSNVIYLRLFLLQCITTSLAKHASSLFLLQATCILNSQPLLRIFFARDMFSPLFCALISITLRSLSLRPILAPLAPSSLSRFLTFIICSTKFKYFKTFSNYKSNKTNLVFHRENIFCIALPYYESCIFL